jgi:hypothetical protein
MHSHERNSIFLTFRVRKEIIQFCSPCSVALPKNKTSASTRSNFSETVFYILSRRTLLALSVLQLFVIKL